MLRFLLNKMFTPPIQTLFHTSQNNICSQSYFRVHLSRLTRPIGLAIDVCFTIKNLRVSPTQIDYLNTLLWTKILAALVIGIKVLTTSLPCLQISIKTPETSCWDQLFKTLSDVTENFAATFLCMI